MKKVILFVMIAMLHVTTNAQTLNIKTGNVTYAIPAAQAGGMAFTDGMWFTVMGRTFPLEEISQMYVDNSEVGDNTVAICYNGTEANVVVAGNIARYVEPTVSGAHVSIVQDGETGEETCGEITYSLSGESADGSFYMEGSYKASVELRGLTLTNLSGAPLDIQNGKRIRNCFDFIR